MRKVIYVAVAVIVTLFVAAGMLLILSPFQYRYACQFQVALYELTYDWTGFEFHSLYEYPGPWGDDDFTGIARIWDKWGTLQYEEGFKKGVRHGLWKEYAEDGSLKRICEYKDGLPWNGVCHIYLDKAWEAEYRNGQSYNGCVSAPEPDADGNHIDICFIDGDQVSAEEFMDYHDISPERKEFLFGTSVFSHKQRTMLSSNNH